MNIVRCVVLHRLCTLVACAAVIAGCGGQTDPRQRVLLGTTHTLQDSGLADELAAAFQLVHADYRLAVLIAGSGELLRIGAAGDVDVLLSHSPDDERAFMAAGHGVARLPVMYNDFVLLGPVADPAGVRATGRAADALLRIAQQDVLFISRGDDSGTHRRERALWAEAGEQPRWSGYLEAGAGMADVLRLASQRGAYTLADRATYELLRMQLDLTVVLEGGPGLRNQYSVIVPVRARNAAGGRLFAEWIRGGAAQELIAGYGEAATGRPLFTPNPDATGT
jgi:tungstate transport system substrate-binding protein